jgi:hypothetical protein
VVHRKLHAPQLSLLAWHVIRLLLLLLLMLIAPAVCEGLMPTPSAKLKGSTYNNNVA